MIESSLSEDAERICISILNKSQSVAITAVIASLVIAFPDKLFHVACILLHTPVFFSWDTYRYTAENTSSVFCGIFPNNKIYDEERKKSNALPFRKKRLEEIIIKYQVDQSDLSDEEYQNRQSLLFETIDTSFLPYAQLSEKEQFLLHRIDVRKMKLVEAKTPSGESGFALVSDLPSNLKQVQKGHEEFLDVAACD